MMLYGGNRQFAPGGLGAGRVRAALVGPSVFLLAAVLAALAVFRPSPGGAHEVRPVIATLQATESGELLLGITLNLEAALAGIGAGHKDTSESPEAATYDRLRSEPPAALRAAFERLSADFPGWIALEADGEAVPLAIAAVDIPEVGDTALPRIFRLELSARRRPAAWTG